MAEWLVNTRWKKYIIVRDIWEHKDKGKIISEELFRSGTYAVKTEGDEPPVFHKIPYPGFNGKVMGIIMEKCGYPVELIALDDGVDMDFTWPDSMTKEEKEEMREVWEDDYFDAWELRGWRRIDSCETWFLDDLDIAKVVPTVKSKKSKIK